MALACGLIEFGALAQSAEKGFTISSTCCSTAGGGPVILGYNHGLRSASRIHDGLPLT
jgi:hypothetical protein